MPANHLALNVFYVRSALPDSSPGIVCPTRNRGTVGDAHTPREADRARQVSRSMPIQGIVSPVVIV